MRARIGGLDRTRLRLWLALFFVALAVPAAVLVYRAYVQAKWEALHQYQVLAEEFVARLDNRLAAIVSVEESRSFSDYAFLVVAGDPAANFVQRSPLSAFPVKTDLPGLIGYFQIDAGGHFSTPLLPRENAQADQYGISGTEFTQRRELEQHVQDILSRNRLVSERRASPAAAPAQSAAELDAKKLDAERPQRAAPAEARSYDAQSAFDKLTDQAKDIWYESERGASEEVSRSMQAFNAKREASTPPVSKTAPTLGRLKRKEQSAIAEPQPYELKQSERADQPRSPPVRVTTFESEIDPFDLSRLGSGHLVLFRKVWRDSQRYIQGALIDQAEFVRNAIAQSFQDTTLNAASDLVVVHNGDMLAAGRPLTSGGLRSEQLLYRGRLSAPLNAMELIFYGETPAYGPSTSLITWLAGILGTILCGGTYLLYRLGARQIALTAQQQDFISAVSHELKTPLTSIRMYGEMLREGWVQDEKKPTYYDYIFSESERLSRLINNVLQLARMTRHEFALECKPQRVAELMDMLLSKISSQVTQAGFTLDWHCDEAAQAHTVNVDADAVAQVLINLVDNAIKFSAKADNKTIEVRCRCIGTAVVLSVRDYGPGLPKDQMKKVFRLFYRLENELTRETVGTGIGLALVQQLARAMHGSVDVANREPGAEFSLRLPRA